MSSPTTAPNPALINPEKPIVDMQELKQEIENLGAFFERRNMTPMEARVFALLLLSEPHYQDFYTIRESLDASKSAVSNAINKLLTSGNIDYRTLPGDRKRYFQVNPNGWLKRMKMEIASVVPMMKQVESIMRKREEMDTPEFNEELARVHRFYAFMAEEFPKMMAKWEELDGRS